MQSVDLSKVFVSTNTDHNLPFAICYGEESAKIIAVWDKTMGQELAHAFIKVYPKGFQSLIGWCIREHLTISLRDMGPALDVLLCTLRKHNA